MKRDVRLQGLSSEHHHALVLARNIQEAVADGSWDEAAETRARLMCTTELAPHFLVEEEVLLPALTATGQTALVERTLVDHRGLRQWWTQPPGAPAAARDFAATLEAHVRFEEREMFPACETLLASSVLDEVARRSPHKRG